MEKNSYYKLYSINLLRWLKIHGFKPISKGVHPNGRTFWIFEMSDGLSEVLICWTKNRNSKSKNLEWKIGQ